MTKKDRHSGSLTLTLHYASILKSFHESAYPSDSELDGLLAKFIIANDGKGLGQCLQSGISIFIGGSDQGS